MNKTKKIIVFLLCIIEVLCVHLTYKAYMNKPVMLDDIKFSDNVVNKKMYGIFVEKSSYSNESDKYEVYNGTTWPSGYELNTTKSVCFDNDGVSIPNPLSFNSGTITITTSNTAYCYLYFDIEVIEMTGLELVASHPDNLSTSLVGGLYRYQGTHDVVDNNYICFGTDNTSTCTSDTDHYMYRIIGINSSGQIKVIKKEALNTLYPWADGEINAPLWPNSSLYSEINGSAYLSNTNYVPTSGVNWQDKIATISWKHGNASSYIYNGDTYYNTYTGWNDAVNAKISLMYPHDYIYAYGVNNPASEIEAVNAWIDLNWNDNNSTDEWTNTRESYGDCVLFVCSGRISYAEGPTLGTIAGNVSTRPVFYLESTATITGSGTISHPYIISN